jgi:hypothetical protein
MEPIRGKIMLKLLRLAAAIPLGLAAAVALGAGAAGATTVNHHHHHARTCTGTLGKPGLLAGTYRGDVVVKGVCFVNGGAAVIRGDLILARGSGLNATFANNDIAGSGKSSLTVHGDVKVGPGAVLVMGCEPNFNPCSDDPNSTGQNTVRGDLTSVRALAVIVHSSSIRGDARVTGGGGGMTCAIPSHGIFKELQSPVFSDFEDNTIRGDLSITGLRTCWLGALRNQVGGDLRDINNKMADPDADEVLTNVIKGDIACFGNSPAVQYGDSMGSPNKVRHHASGECGFNVRQPNPSPSGPLTPISIKI